MTQRSALAPDNRETMPENTPADQEKLTCLREEIHRQELNGLLLPRTDEYQSEFLAPYAEHLSWLTGFTGSAGYAAILEDQAVIMSDGRYTLQLKEQVDTRLYQLADSTETSPGQWLVQNALGKKAVIGYDPWLHTPKQLEALREKLEGTDITLKAVTHNPLDAVWSSRPERQSEPVILFPEDLTGQSVAEKRELIAHTVRETNARCCVIGNADSVCWLLNIRGNDVPYTPVALSFALVYEDASVDWFIEESRVPAAVRDHLGPAVRIFAREELEERLSRAHGRSVMLDRTTTCAWFEETLLGYAAQITHHKDPCKKHKAIKTPAEQDAIREAHLREGVALVRLLKWIDKSEKTLDEIEVSDKLEEFRKLEPAYRQPSFPTIAGAGENGAIIHYGPDEKSNATLKTGQLFLLDAGGQYLGQGVAGTTDMTRTICIGKPTEQMRQDYTSVLKGHIAVSKACFPQGTKGVQIDALARAPLWLQQKDYKHGTGHGVGCYLGVHEDAASISPRGQEPFEPGMLISNEPGYYSEGEYGIRIENLMFVKDAEGSKTPRTKSLCFETITFVPYARNLIVAEELSKDEKSWLNEYNKQVLNNLKDRLSEDEAAWLKQQVKEIGDEH